MLRRPVKAARLLLNAWARKPEQNSEYILKSIKFNQHETRLNSQITSEVMGFKNNFSTQKLQPNFSTFVFHNKQEEQQFINSFKQPKPPLSFQQRAFFSTAKEQEIEYLKQMKEKKITLKDVPEEERTFLLCLAHIDAVPEPVRPLTQATDLLRRGVDDIQRMGETIKEREAPLRDVPLKIKTEKFCLYAVQKNGLNLEFVPEDKQTPEVLIAAFRQNGLSRPFVKNEDKVTEEMDLITVKGVGHALQYVKNRTEKVCDQALETSPLASQYVPPEYMTKTRWVSTLERDGNMLRHVPKEKRDQDIYLAAAKGGCSLEDIPEENRTFAVYVEIVKTAASHLGDVPANWREHVIDTVTPETILADNFMAHEFFPKLPKYEGIVEKYLAKNENIFLSNYQVETEAEVKSFRFQYGNLPHDIEKTICIQKLARTQTDDFPVDNLEKIMQLRARVQGGDKDLNLIIVGHHNGESRVMSGLTPQKISDIVAAYPVIKNVTLLGCNTAKAKVLNEEIGMIKKFHENYELQHPTNGVKSGFVALSSLPDTKTFPDLLARVHLEEVYLLVNTKTGNHYLVDIKKTNDVKPDFNISILSDEDFKQIEKRFTAGKKIAFPKNEKDKYVLRNLDKPLTKEELECLQDIQLNQEQDKVSVNAEKNYPFLSNLTIDENEMTEKVRPSFFGEVAKAIQTNPNIKQSVNLRGYAKPIYIDSSKEHAADKPEAKLYASSTQLYPPGQHSSAFFSGSDNINRDKLKEEWSKNIKKLKAGKYDENEDTSCKSITVTIKK